MTEDYVALFKHLNILSAWDLLSYFLLSAMRIAPIVVLAPFFGAKLLPMPVRMGIVLCLSVILFPNVVFNSHHPLPFDYTFIGYALKELMIGFVLGYLIAIPFYIVQSAGVFIDFQRGSSAMQASDPVLQNQASPIGLLYNYILIVLFFQIDGPFYFLEAVRHSFSVIPADHFLNVKFFNPNFTFWKLSVGLMAELFKLAVQIAAPPLVAILMTDMFLGITNRLAPQVQIAFLGMSIKSLLGLLLIWAGWSFLLIQMGKIAKVWLQFIYTLIQNFQL